MEYEWTRFGGFITNVGIIYDFSCSFGGDTDYRFVIQVGANDLLVFMFGVSMTILKFSVLLFLLSLLANDDLFRWAMFLFELLITNRF